MSRRDIVIVTGFVTDESHLPQVEIGTMDRPGLLNMAAEDALHLAESLLKVAEQTIADAMVVQWALHLRPDQPVFAASLMESLREFRNKLDAGYKDRQEEI